MKRTSRGVCLGAFGVLACCGWAMGVENALVNPGFLDVDTNGEFGDGWGVFGAADFNDFFGGNPHASFYGDNAGNSGGVYQVSLPAVPGIAYQFILTKVRIEANWDADLVFGLEYYAADDTTKLGESVVVADTATRIAQGRVDDNVFATSGTAVAGAAYVRPIVRFENVNAAYSGQSQAALFVFDTFLSAVPAPGQEYLLNSGFDDTDGDGAFGDYWGSYGAAGFNDFFGGDPHASLFADTMGNFGGIYQQGVIGKPGTTYLLALDDVRVEESFDGSLSYGLEYYAADDFTKLGETIAAIDTTLTGNGLAYAMTGTAVAGTAFVRPVISFDDVSTTGALQNVFVFEATMSEPAPGVDMLTNPGFEDTDTNGEFGDGWGAYGSAGFHDFWTGNPHASLFGDWFDNEGGVFQLRIPGVAGIPYQFDLLDTRVEASLDADLHFGLEYYAADDATKIGETLVLIDTASRLALGSTDGNVFSMQGAPPAGTAYVRPIIRLDNVNEDYLAEPDSSAFVFRTYLGKAPRGDEQRLKNPAFGDTNGDGNFGDYWGQYGTVGFNEFFGAGNSHASFFAETIGNAGGIYQQAVLAAPGASYRFELTDVRVEDDFDAELYYGLEYYGDDDTTKLGETLVLADTSVTGDGLAYTMTGTAVAGTVYVRPIVFFDNVATTGGTQRNVFVFASSLVKLTLPGDADDDGDVDLDDYAAFADCLAGPNTTPAPAGPLSVGECYDAFDLDDDGDVDLQDAALFCASFSG